jgi:hypothetical protein
MVTEIHPAPLWHCANGKWTAPAFAVGWWQDEAFQGTGLDPQLCCGMSGGSLEVDTVYESVALRQTQLQPSLQRVLIGARSPCSKVPGERLESTLLVLLWDRFRVFSTRALPDDLLFSGRRLKPMCRMGCLPDPEKWVWEGRGCSLHMARARCATVGATQLHRALIMN